MKTSLRGIIALAVSEGIVVAPYLDSVGIWTIGVGHTASAGNPDPNKMTKGKEITVSETLDIFARDLAKFEKRVNDLVKVPLTQNEFDALVHFDFNTGGLHRSKLLTEINKGNKKAAGETGFHGWLKPIELKSRRDKERDMFLKGVYGSTAAPLYTADAKGKTIRKGTYNLTQNVLEATQTPVQSVIDKVGAIPSVPVKLPVSGWKALLHALGVILSKLFRG